MTEESIDLTLLHPNADKLTAAIAAQCAPLLSARREHATVVHIARWWWPTLAASFLVAAASAAILALPLEKVSERPQAATARRAPSPRIQLAEAVGVPRLLARSLTSRRPPSLSDLLEQHR